MEKNSGQSSRATVPLKDSSMKILVFCFFVKSTLNEPQGHTQIFFEIGLEFVEIFKFNCSQVCDICQKFI
jgi:hypothetical protein